MLPIRCRLLGSQNRCRSAATASAGRSCKLPLCWQKRLIPQMTKSMMRWLGTFAGVECTSEYASPFTAPRKEPIMPLSRRAFVVAGSAAGAGILIGVRIPGLSLLAQENQQGAQKPVPNPFVAWVHVKPTGEISLIVAKSEMGQGIRTGLAIPLAEEAEVDLNHVTVEQAETRPDIYTHMGTGGSHSTRQNYM